QPEPQRHREHESERRVAVPDGSLYRERARQTRADPDDEHHRILELHARVELAERVEHRAAHERRVEQRTRASLPRDVHDPPPPATICRCSTTGPSASAGRNVSAPTSSTVPTSRTTKSGPCVGSVPAPAGTSFLRASAPASARTTTIGT